MEAELAQNLPIRSKGVASSHQAWQPEAQSSDTDQKHKDGYKDFEMTTASAGNEESPKDPNIRSDDIGTQLPPQLSSQDEQLETQPRDMTHLISNNAAVGLGLGLHYESVLEQERGTDLRNEKGLELADDQERNQNVVTESVGTERAQSFIRRDFSYSENAIEAPSVVSWDTETHVDPAWGLSLETSQLEHTNTFPAVPPLHNRSEHPEHPLPHSQVEDIMEGYEAEATEIEADCDFATAAKDQRPYSDPFGASANANSDSLHLETGGISHGLSSTPPDEEARFEEGLPLLTVESTVLPRANSFMHQQSEDFFGPDSQQQANEDDFFTNIQPDDTDKVSVFKPTQIERKTTNQVLNSMQYPSRSKVHDGIPTNEWPPNAETLTGGGIAVSTSTIISQIIVEKAQDQGHEGNGKFDENRLSAKDEDLASMWQEALADDDFLEDEDSSADPVAFFEEDEDGFLDEADIDGTFQNDLSPPIPQPVTDRNSHMHGFTILSTGTDRSIFAGATAPNRYTPQQGPTGFSPVGTPISGIQSLYTPGGFGDNLGTFSGFADGLGQQSSYQNQVGTPLPQLTEKPQSFVDKSKGGYTSPYDLPMDVSRPKKRAVLQHLQSTGSRDLGGMPPPPPRSSSMQSSAISPTGQSGYQPSPTNAPGPGTSPSVSSPMAYSPNPNVVQQSKPRTGSFFEELPVTSKPRPPSNAGRFIPPQVNQFAPTLQQVTSQYGQFNQVPQSPPQPANTPNTYQLLPPERILPFANYIPPAVQNQSVPAANARYSPAPPVQPNVPLSRNRYATPPAGPPARPPSVSQNLPFQPRTSSPLARSASASQQHRLSSQAEVTSISNEHFPTGSRRPSLRSTMTEQPITSSVGSTYQSNANFPVPTGSHNPQEMSTTTRTPYHHPLQQSQLMSPDNRTFEPPLRSQTQPALQPDTRTTAEPRYQRVASINDPTSPNTPNSYFIPQPASLSKAKVTDQSSLTSISYIAPCDGQEHDPLERWKGCPVFNFGFGGHVVTSFPQHIPRYTTGQVVPMIKCAPGEVKVRSVKIIPLDEHIATFPGPLKSKGKKKEVLVWLEKGMLRLEQQRISIIPSQTPVDARKRQEEKILLWRILHLLVEHDGAVDGNPAAEKAIRQILSPELAFAGPPDQLSYGSVTRPRGISSAGAAQSFQAPTDPGNIDSMRKLLLVGEREKAVWHAVDKQMWGHAMLIASTMGGEIWKQVAQEFVRLEVRTAGDNVESLAALYDVFSGNWEESVDELVPPSARAGLQMVSKTAGHGSTKNALEGLDRWRETLSLILSNRSADDSKALVALGQLLSGYGRIEAAHICYILSKAPGLFGGPGDTQASITLLGTDHVKQASNYGRDLDSILITEVYEFVYAVLAPSAVSTIAPHLQAHKLHHAMVLAEYGYRDEAQQYCDAIMNALKATTKLSPYYHAQLFSSLDDLSSRLRQGPKDGPSSWINKPSMDKVSGSVWNRFNQFISGDDSDGASTGSGKGLDGPFAKITGDTPPSISRTQSPDLYGTYVNGDIHKPSVSAIPLPPSNNRYAPGGMYTPRTSLEQPSQPLADTQRLGHLESLKQADLQRYSSYSSLPTLSPDLYQKQKQPPDAYQQAKRPASTTFSPGREHYPPTSSTKSSYSPQALGPSPYSPQQGIEPHFSHPDYQTSNSAMNHEPSPLSHHLSPHAVDLRSPPYEPRSASSQTMRSPSSIRQRSPAYAPRSASLEPRTSSYQPSPAFDKPLPSATYEASASYESQASYEPPTLSSELSPEEPSSAPFEPSPSYGYEPPTTSSYDPPSYDPETQTDETSPVQERSRRKGFMDDDDDDDDLITKAAALKREEKARKDREADEAFRKAAEADAQKDSRPSASTKGSSWLISWIPGTKSKDLSSPSSSGGGTQKVIRARLGEESSFVYDESLKKWVNKKAGAEAPPVSAPTPPPPKAPPSRAASAAGGPPTGSKPLPTALGAALSPGSGPPSNAPSRNVSPSSARAESPLAARPGSGHSAGSGAGSGAYGATLAVSGAVNSTGGSSAIGPPSAPPSRPATGVSAAGSIDDLLGAPQARKGGTVKRAKKGRGYVDVMAK